MIRTFATAALLALTIGTAQADPPPAIIIPIGDLNLSNPGDVHILASRAQAAAETACADWSADSQRRDAFFTSIFYKKIYADCIDSTRQRVTSRAMAKAAERTARMARN